jgi:hypothetical protein
MEVWIYLPPDDNPEAKAAIGHKFGQWVFAGHLEVVPDNASPRASHHRTSKKGKEKFCNISDLDDWGVCYYSARDFGNGMAPCAIVLREDVTKGYHIVQLPGC